MTNTAPSPNWIPDVSTFGARLALVRWRMGWNLREAERECNLSQNTWGGYEEGREPRKFVEVVNRIVLRTQVNKVWLMTGEGSPEPTTQKAPTPRGEGLSLPGLDSNQEPADYLPGEVVHVDFTHRKVVGA